MDRSKTDPNWPIGYPFVVVHNFPRDNAALPSTSIRIQTGDHGRVTTKESSNHNICVQYPRDSSGTPGREGWVPRNHIQIGTKKSIADPIVIQVDEPEVGKLPANLYIDKNASSGRLGRTVSGPLSAWYEGREDLPTQPEIITEMLSSQADIRKHTQKILQGIGRVDGRLRQCLDQEDFTLVDLQSIAPDGKTDDHVGIYVFVHWRFKGQPYRAPEIYVGSTTRSFKIRQEQHMTVMGHPDTKGVHYTAAKAADRHRLFPICYLTVDDAESPEVKLAEQVITSLLQTTCKEVLNFGADGFTGEAEEQTGQTGAPDSVSKVSKYYVHKAEAVVLRKLADQVFERTGWPGGCKRAAGRTPFGSNVGLNWTSPLTEGRKERIIWTKATIAGKFVNFRRTDLLPRRVTGGGGKDSLQVYLKHHTPTNTAWIVLLRSDETEDWPPETAKLNVVFELRLDGEAHSAGLSRAPGVGALSDWANANQLRMRIEWELPNGVWMQRQYQLRDDNEKLSQAPNGAMQSYNIGNGLRSYLLQEHRVLTPAQKKWVWDFDIARVKEVYLDHLDRVIRVRDLKNQRDVPGPTFKSMDQIGQELVNLGAGRYARDTDTQYPIFPAGHATRTRCNHCMANKILGKSAHQSTCSKVPGKNTCERCQRWGRPCTFVDTRELERNSALIRALANPIAVSSTPTRVVGNNEMERYRA